MKLEETIIILPKSKIKAGDGKKEGKYLLYRSSNKIDTYYDEYIIDTEAIIVGTGGNPSIHYNIGKCAYTTQCLAITSKGTLKNKYIYYYLLSQLDRIQNMFRGMTIKQLDKKEFFKLDIPIIEFDIQDKIIENLDIITNNIQSKKEQVKKLEQLVKSQFVEMFGTIKENKKDYPIKTLIEVFELIKDGTHSTPVYTTDQENGVKFLSAKDVSKGRIDWENTKYIPIELHEKLVKRIKPQLNDILLAKNGTTGICAKVNNEEIFDIYVSLALLRPNLENSSDYLVHAINNEETKEQFEKSLKGVGVPNLHLGEIKKVKIIVPPITLQNEFSEIVKQIDKQKFESMIQLKMMEKIYNIINDRRRYV